MLPTHTPFLAHSEGRTQREARMPSQKARSDAEVLPECHERIAPKSTSGKAETAAPGRHESLSAGQLCGSQPGLRAIRPQLGLAIPSIGHPIGGHLGGWHRELETLHPITPICLPIRSQRRARRAQFLGFDTASNEIWRRRPDLNRGWRFCRLSGKGYVVDSSCFLVSARP